jgi:hypothetical protein
MVEAGAVRRIALELPEVEDRSDDRSLRFYRAGKQFAWTWMKRIHPKKPRVANFGVLAVLCEPQLKEILLEAEPQLFFVDDHLRGYPAVLVRLDQVDEGRLRDLLRRGGGALTA